VKATTGGSDGSVELDVAERNALMLKKHVDDLLDVAKLESGRMEIDYAETDLAHLVRFAASHFELLASEKRLALTVDAAGPLPVHADAEKILRVVMNLLSNAFKFTPAGGSISLSATLAGSRARVCVSDSGPGVPAADRGRIFERFRQGNSSATRPHGGTGLGLAIVKEFV